METQLHYRFRQCLIVKTSTTLKGYLTMITRTMRYRFNAGADLRKVKSALNRTITICRKAKLFDLAQEALKTKNNLIRGHK
jgi:hypothetical protein